jgi:hypothetical protein
MMESRSPTDLVLTLVQVINGDLPLITAQEILDPRVQIRMGSADYCGIDIWCKWIYLLHNCGRVSDLRIARCETWCDAQEPDLVHLSARWTGTVRSQREPAESASAKASYLVRDGCIRKICTHQSNYEFVFGIWARYSVLFWIFLGWNSFILCLRRFVHRISGVETSIVRSHQQRRANVV